MDGKKLLRQFQFLGLNKVPRGKFRWTWVAFMVLLMWGAVNIVVGTVVRFLDHPTYIVKMEKIRKIIEFPSVQLCPEIDFPEYKMEEFLSKMNFPRKMNISYARSVLRQLAAYYAPDVEYDIGDLERLQYLLDYNQIDVYTATLEMTMSCEESLLKCRWNGRNVKCQNIFKMELTNCGYCCVFNGRSLRKELLMYGIHKVKPKIIYYTRSVGFLLGLMFAVNQSSLPIDIDLSYKWVSIDGGQNYVDASNNGTPLAPGVEMWIGHRNNGFHVDDDAKSLDTKLRGCHLTSEGLKLFPVYHKKYCQLECRIAHFMKICNCALFTFPVPADVPRCRANQIKCAENALKTFSEQKCLCTHTCDVDTDSVEVNTFPLMSRPWTYDRFYDDLDINKSSVVRVFIAQRDVKTSSRRTYYSHLDLFGQLGGVFNMFFGCSILSMLELLHLGWHALKNWRKVNHVRPKGEKIYNKDIRAKKKPKNEAN